MDSNNVALHENCISMKIPGVVGVDTRNDWLGFGGDPDHNLDPGIFKRIP